jgi:hypothetical protein
MMNSSSSEEESDAEDLCANAGENHAYGLGETELALSQSPAFEPHSPPAVPQPTRLFFEVQPLPLPPPQPQPLPPPFTATRLSISKHDMAKVCCRVLSVFAAQLLLTAKEGGDVAAEAVSEKIAGQRSIQGLGSDADAPSAGGPEHNGRKHCRAGATSFSCILTYSTGFFHTTLWEQ